MGTEGGCTIAHFLPSRALKVCSEREKKNSAFFLLIPTGLHDSSNQGFLENLGKVTVVSEH